MKKGFSEIAIVIDRSGSMNSLWDEAIGGFNSLIETQKKEEGTANITVAVFDNEYALLCDGVDINSIQGNLLDSCSPRGTTALYDAIGKTIDSLGNRLDLLSEDEKPETVLIGIITDGLDNASAHYTSKQVSEMVKHQQDKYNWKFTFLAANQDATLSGSQVGISNAVTYSATSKGMATGYDTLSRGFSLARKSS